MLGVYTIMAITFKKSANISPFGPYHETLRTALQNWAEIPVPETSVQIKTKGGIKKAISAIEHCAARGLTAMAHKYGQAVCNSSHATDYEITLLEELAKFGLRYLSVPNTYGAALLVTLALDTGLHAALGKRRCVTIAIDILTTPGTAFCPDIFYIGMMRLHEPTQLDLGIAFKDITTFDLSYLIKERTFPLTIDMPGARASLPRELAATSRMWREVACDTDNGANHYHWLSDMLPENDLYLLGTASRLDYVYADRKAYERVCNIEHLTMKESICGSADMLTLLAGIPAFCYDLQTEQGLEAATRLVEKMEPLFKDHPMVSDAGKVKVVKLLAAEYTSPVLRVSQSIPGMVGFDDRVVEAVLHQYGVGMHVGDDVEELHLLVKQLIIGFQKIADKWWLALLEKAVAA
jgi:hypothetical protein